MAEWARRTRRDRRFFWGFVLVDCAVIVAAIVLL